MDFEENIRIGKRIAALRRSVHLTQVEVAAYLGKPQSYVSKIESGERSVHLSEVMQLSSSLDQSPSSFVYFVLGLNDNGKDDNEQGASQTNSRKLT